MDLLEMLVEMEKARTAYLDMKRTEKILRAGGNDQTADGFQKRADAAGADWEKWFRASTKAAME